MNEEGETNKERCRSWWQNSVEEADEEILAIDKMEEAIEPLDEETTKIRGLITGMEMCYHEADIEAERIIKAIGSGRYPPESNERPPQRKRELQNSLDILLAWCEGDSAGCPALDVGGIWADELVPCLGKRTTLKIWQVQRVIDKLRQALDPSCSYHNMALDIDGYGQPIDIKAEEYYKDAAEFLQQTKETIIHDTVDGQEAKMSLAMAIDMLEPCNWDFVGSIVTLLKAIGGNLHPERPYVCHQRNLKLSPLCDRMRTISNTLGAFWKEEEETDETIDRDTLASLGEVTEVKRWLAASLDKTIRLQLEAPSDFWLTFC